MSAQNRKLVIVTATSHAGLLQTGQLVWVSDWITSYPLFNTSSSERRVLAT